MLSESLSWLLLWTSTSTSLFKSTDAPCCTPGSKLGKECVTSAAVCRPSSPEYQRKSCQVFAECLVSELKRENASLRVHCHGQIMSHWQARAVGSSVEGVQVDEIVEQKDKE